MTDRYLDILDQEIALFEEGISIELEKRKAILSADGAALQRLTGQSVEFQRRALQSETVRFKLEKDFFPQVFQSDDAPSLTKITEALSSKSPEMADHIADTAQRYRETVRRLKAENDENLRLLKTSAQAMGRLLHNLHDLAGADSHKTYGPQSENPTRTGRARAVLVNANA